MKLQSKQFELLKKKWYAKLKREGFNDLENTDDSLKSWELSRYYRGADKKFYKTAEERMGKGLRLSLTKQEYFRLVGHFLHDHKFEDNVQKLVWEYHAEGTSYRKIVKLLKHRRIKRNLMEVFFIIRDLKKIMLERYKRDE